MERLWKWTVQTVRKAGQRVQRALRGLNDWILTRGGVPILNVLGVQAFVHSYAYTQLFRYVEHARNYLKTCLDEEIKRRVDEAVRRQVGQALAEVEARIRKTAETLEKDLEKRINGAKKRLNKRTRQGGEHAS